MANEGQGVRVTAPPAPTKGDEVLAFASALMRWLAREMPSFGYGFTTAYGPNRMIRASDILTAHPFKVVQVAANKVRITPGFCAAMGASDHVPTFADTTNPITDTPAEEKTITEESLILLRVTYDTDEVWQSTSILIEDSSFNYTDTYTNGYLLIATVYWNTTDSRIDRIVQGVTTSISHSKCNIYHNWQATGQVPASLAGTFQPPQAASDPSGVTEGYLYYNTTDDIYRYYDGAAWHTL